MQMLKCESCGAEIGAKGGGNVIVCEYCQTSHILGKNCQLLYEKYGHTFLLDVHKAVCEYYNLVGLQQVCFDLVIVTGDRGLGYEEVAGSTVRDKSRELILAADRHRRIVELVEQLAENSRGFAIWLEAYS